MSLTDRKTLLKLPVIYLDHSRLADLMGAAVARTRETSFSPAVKTGLSCLTFSGRSNRAGKRAEGSDMWGCSGFFLLFDSVSFGGTASVASCGIPECPREGASHASVPIPLSPYGGKGPSTQQAVEWREINASGLRSCGFWHHQPEIPKLTVA